DVDDAAAGLLAVGRGKIVKQDRIVDLTGEIREVVAAGDAGSDRGHHVAAVKRRAALPRAPCDLPYPIPVMNPPRPGDQAVVRADDVLLAHARDDQPTVRADARVDDGQMHRFRWEPVDGALQRDRGA